MKNDINNLNVFCGKLADHEISVDYNLHGNCSREIKFFAVHLIKVHYKSATRRVGSEFRLKMVRDFSISLPARRIIKSHYRGIKCSP